MILIIEYEKLENGYWQSFSKQITDIDLNDIKQHIELFNKLYNSLNSRYERVWVIKNENKKSRFLINYPHQNKN